MIKDKIKTITRSVLPPILFKLKRNVYKIKERDAYSNIVWSGNYTSWKDAESKSKGYDSKKIFLNCEAALLKVKNGEAVYERDSVLFDEIEYSWGLLAGLQKAALGNNGKLNVLDFGGSLGSSFYQNKEFLSGLTELKWNVIEQPHFVESGKKHFEDDHLKFYFDIKECLQSQNPNVLLLSSVLQYLEKPYDYIQTFISLQIPYIIIDRTAFVNYTSDILTVQNVPPEIYPASYPCWFFTLENFEKKFTGYKVLARFNSHEGFKIELDNNITATYKGLILQYDK